MGACLSTAFGARRDGAGAARTDAHPEGSPSGVRLRCGAAHRSPALAHTSSDRRAPEPAGPSGFSALKTGSADLICQTQLENRDWDNVDWRRTGIFCLWGFGYLGGVQYFIYAYAFPVGASEY